MKTVPGNKKRIKNKSWLPDTLTIFCLPMVMMTLLLVCLLDSTITFMIFILEKKNGKN
tara:strand:- start:379 stop:552 length:174 start_codon:yes stop_codon:yes gene_type:complete